MRRTSTIREIPYEAMLPFVRLASRGGSLSVSHAVAGLLFVLAFGGLAASRCDAAGPASPSKPVQGQAPDKASKSGQDKNRAPGLGKPIFYPPPPQPPRLQFLVSYSDESDLGVRSSRLSAFITGAKAPMLAIGKPYGVVMSSNQIIVCDTGNHGLSLLDLAQKSLRVFRPKGPGALSTPINVAIDAEGTRYIADSTKGQVLVFANDGSYQGTVGLEKGMRPTGVALYKDRVFVTDLNSRSVRVYAKADGKLLFTMPPDRVVPVPGEAAKPADKEGDADKEKGKDKDADADKDAKEGEAPPPKKNTGDLMAPANIAIDGSGQVYVSDTIGCRVQIYDSDGKFLRGLGSEGDGWGQFARPRGVAIDREARVYVVDGATQVCQIFDKEGRLLIFIGEPDGSAAALNMPAGIYIDYEHVGLFKKYVAPDFVVENLVIISNQYGDRKVSVYGLGHKKA